MTIAVITGITGQDGAYLARNLLQRGHRVIGTYRRTGSLNFWRIEELGVDKHPNLTLAELDLMDIGSCIRLIERYQPDHFYNFAAQSFVGVSFGQPVATAQITGVGVLHCLEAIRCVNRKIRFYQASSSELYGRVTTDLQGEETPFHPRSPYAVAKLFGHWITINYRESYDMFTSVGILFNHESPLRGREFVTRKITCGVAAIKLGKEQTLHLGNLNAERDWGYADEYVEGVRLMMEETDTPDCFVLATGVTSSVRHFVEASFAAADMPIVWKGEGVNEVGVDAQTGKTLVAINPEFFRPAEVDRLKGDASKVERILGWKAKTTVAELAEMMVKADLRRSERGNPM
ncbi:MAG: GDP-mannose 4,6-dehydratase [Hyphomonadaceae bacterium]|nr:GDP-mannose 4,6-dehydratase [Hyphomonadaceae bacterium]